MEKNPEKEKVLVIEPHGKTYRSTKGTVMKKFHISIKQINFAIKSGHLLKRHYFDEV